MTGRTFIESRVADYYWEKDLNCATTALKILAEQFGPPLDDQVVAAAVGMHGAGEYGAQCGLVEGTLMFLGIYGRRHNVTKTNISRACNAFAAQFEHEFSSLLCSVLRPEGFHQDNPPHLCEPLTCRAITLSMAFIDAWQLESGRSDAGN